MMPTQVTAHMVKKEVGRESFVRWLVLRAYENFEYLAAGTGQ